MKRLIATVALALGVVLPSWAATPVYPAATNANNTFFKTNTFMTNVYIGGQLQASNTVKIIGALSDLIVGGTNIVSSSGSLINAVGLTNGAVTAPNGLTYGGTNVLNSGGSWINGVGMTNRDIFGRSVTMENVNVSTGDGDATLTIDGSGFLNVNNQVSASSFNATDNLTVATTNVLAGAGSYINGVGITNKNMTIDGTLTVSNDVSIVGASSDLTVGGLTTTKAMLINAGTGGITSGTGAATNALEVSTDYSPRAFLVHTNGDVYANGTYLRYANGVVSGSISLGSGYTYIRCPSTVKAGILNIYGLSSARGIINLGAGADVAASDARIHYTNDVLQFRNGGNTYDINVSASNATFSGSAKATNGITSLASVTATNFVTSAVKWIDIPMNYSFSSLGPAAPALTATYTGSAIKCLAFDNDAILYAQGQFQHNVAVTNAAFPDFIFEPHVHFSLIGATPGATTSNVTWRCEWEFADIGGTWTKGTNSITYGVAATNTHYMAELGHITNNSATPHLSSVFRCRLMRPESGGQEYSTSAEVLMDAFDLHIPVGNQNAIGSSQDSSP